MVQQTRLLHAGIGDLVFFKLCDDFVSQRRTDFRHDFKNSSRSYPIILLRGKLLFKGKLCNLLEEILHISRCKLRCHLYDALKIDLPCMKFGKVVPQNSFSLIFV